MKRSFSSRACLNRLVPREQKQTASEIFRIASPSTSSTPRLAFVTPVGAKFVDVGGTVRVTWTSPDIDRQASVSFRGNYSLLSIYSVSKASYVWHVTVTIQASFCVDEIVMFRYNRHVESRQHNTIHVYTTCVTLVLYCLPHNMSNATWACTERLDLKTVAPKCLFLRVSLNETHKYHNLEQTRAVWQGFLRLRGCNHKAA